METQPNLSEIIKIPNFSMMICSKRRTGKSVFMRDLVSQIYDRYKSCYVFSKSLKFQNGMYDFCPEANRVDHFDEGVLKRIWSEQERYITEKTKNYNASKHGNFDDYKKSLDHVLIVLDDIIGDKGVRSSKVFDDLFILGRHLNLAVIAISQYYSSKGGYSVTARKNLDYIVSFYLDTQSDKVHLIDDFISKQSRKDGLALYNRLTTEKPFQCVIICNNVLSTNYDDYVFPYVAKTEVEPFVIDGKKRKKASNAPAIGNLTESVAQGQIVFGEDGRYDLDSFDKFFV